MGLGIVFHGPPQIFLSPLFPILRRHISPPRSYNRPISTNVRHSRLSMRLIQLGATPSRLGQIQPRSYQIRRAAFSSHRTARGRFRIRPISDSVIVAQPSAHTTTSLQRSCEGLTRRDYRSETSLKVRVSSRTMCGPTLTECMRTIWMRSAGFPLQFCFPFPNF